MTFNLAIGPRVRKSPYFDATVASGVTAFNVYNHMYMPVSYGDPMAEYERLINGVAMWDVAVERQGSGRFIAFCNGATTFSSRHYAKMHSPTEPIIRHATV